MRLTSTFLIFGLLAAAQVKSPKGDISITGTMVAAPTGVAQAGPQFVKAADGKWHCMNSGRPCTEPQLKAMGTVVKSKSNITNNLVLNPDGTLGCTKAGKPCSDDELQRASSQLNSAALQNNSSAR